jgi:hypothetical protein
MDLRVLAHDRRMQNLIAVNLWNDVLVMTYSEFGRRVRQNASGGTDHGTAAPLFVMGRRREGRPVRRLPVTLRPHRRRPQAHRRLPQRVRHGGAGLLGRQRDFGLRQPQGLGFL